MEEDEQSGGVHGPCILQGLLLGREMRTATMGGWKTWGPGELKGLKMQLL